MNYIESYFQEMGLSVQQKPPIIPFVDLYVLQHNDPDMSLVFRWKGVNNNSLNASVLEPMKNKLKSILLKGIEFDGNTDYDYDTLKQFIDSYYPKLSPEEKLDSVLEFVNGQTSYEGEAVELVMPDDTLANNYYFNGSNEWVFYLDTAINLKLVYKYDSRVFGVFPNPFIKYNLTIAGLTRLLKVKKKNESKLCFIAIAFNDEMEIVYREAIAAAVIVCGFEPYIVNRIHVESDKTINDTILAGIKKARFTIADFTHHKNGVYFEAGYALGRGQKVIYTCKANDLSNSHFDTRNYQHVVWSDITDLKTKLIDKIEAFILD